MRSARRISDWRIWSAGFVLLYLAANLSGWTRTLLPDEIRPLLLAQQPFRATLDYAQQDLVQTPGSYVVQRFWLQTFGHTDSVAKALALLINIPTIVLFTFLASNLTRYWHIVGLLFTFTLMRVGAPVNLVRMYGLLLFFCVAALVLWNEWRQSARTRALAGWTIAMTAAVYAHASALLLLPAFVLANTLFGPRRPTFALAAATPILALMPWVLYVSPVLADRGIAANVAAIHTDPTRAIAALPFYLLSGEAAGAASPLEEYYRRGVSPWLKWGALVLNIAILGCALRGIRSHSTRRLSTIRDPPWLASAALLVAVPVATLYAFSLIFEPVVHLRYLIAATPAYWLLLVQLAERGGRPAWLAVSAMALWMAGSIIVVLMLHRDPSVARRGVDRVAEQLASTDVIVVDDYMPLGFQVYWEWTRRLRRAEPVHVLLTAEVVPWARSMLPSGSLDEIDFGSAQRVWLFRDGRRHLPRITEYLAARGFRRVDEQGEPTRSLVLFEKDASAGTRRVSG